ncbi:Uncharacterized membrane protein [Shimia gijangensis]|uniref:Uncharacterized membrane protein n=1 Tax=Shimia gijangensis TaxID=1470563 RepID=A0A1M6SKZ0_9RHOB|nr:hypothetical protein [Shimia gijangensis]SHK45320.1 Uncharacterized membrane protein [Shimia gijangensis]
MKAFITKTLVTGVFLLIPVGVLGFALSKAFGKLRKLAEPLAAKFEIETAAGILALDALMVMGLIVGVFLVGLIAYLPIVAARADRIDQRLEGNVPGYSVLKGIIGGALNHETSMKGFKTVVARHNGVAQIGFEVERTETGEIVVFLPSTPSPRTGITALFNPRDVDPLNVPPHKALEMLTFFGKGTAAILGDNACQGGLSLAHTAQAA